MCHVFLIQLPCAQRQCDLERYLMGFEPQKYVLQAFFSCSLPAFSLDKEEAALAKNCSTLQPQDLAKRPRLDL